MKLSSITRETARPEINAVVAIDKICILFLELKYPIFAEQLVFDQFPLNQTNVKSDSSGDPPRFDEFCSTALI